MKRFTAFFFSFILAFSFTMTAFADGDTNIDGGGGGMGDGSGLDGGANANYWNPGNDGVRVTIVRERDQKQMTTPVDFTNVNLPPGALFFGYKSKLNYRKGAKLSPQVGNKYDYKTPASPIPPIISSNGSTNIAAVKRYFSDEGVLRDLCAKTGFSFEELLTKKYVILLEPIAYFRFEGALYAATSHEAALFDRMYSGKLKSKMGNLTHQNLPLSMFLERPDLGFPVYSGSTGGVKTNEVILSSLGLGTVRIGEQGCCNHPPNCPCLKPDGSCSCPEDHPGESCEESDKCKCPKYPQAETYDYVFHPDTDVITSVYYNPGQEVSPDDDGRVTFNILGKRYTKGFVCPDGDGQLIWVKWHTPKEPQIINIPVTSNLGDNLGTITCKVEELEEHTPPHPTYYDKKPSSSWRVPSRPSIPYKNQLTWGEWSAYWEYDCDCDDCDCDDCDCGYWEYEWNPCKASLSVSKCEIYPDERVKTERPLGNNNWEMKSGYGVDVDLVSKSSISRSGASTDFTQPQNVIAYFPEFDYKTYDRVLEHTGSNGHGEKFQFKVNRYSYYGSRVHFTKHWFPDNKDYKVYFQVLDAWTPAGQLSYVVSDSVHIEGVVWDDYTWGNVQ